MYAAVVVTDDSSKECLAEPLTLADTVREGRFRLKGTSTLLCITYNRMDLFVIVMPDNMTSKVRPNGIGGESGIAQIRSIKND